MQDVVGTGMGTDGEPSHDIREQGGLIDVEALSGDHALSESNQPYFSDLLKVICDGDTPITLIVGAGVSQDSGLPSWDDLLNRMVDQIPSEQMRKLARADTSAGATRRAEYIQQLVQERTTKSSHEIVREALYLKTTNPEPGELANALARLIASAPHRFTVLTTNFDEIIETALRSRKDSGEVESVSLGVAEQSESLTCTHKLFKIVHLHGMLRRNSNRHLEPLVLTEAEFLRQGSRIRQLIAGRLAESSVIFIGLSLADPNLVGPLWDIAHDGGALAMNQPEHFVLTVARDIGKDMAHGDENAPSLYEAFEYEIAKAGYLDKTLSLRPVFMKSYSQLIQLVSDMALASIEPVRYRKKATARDSLRYGRRLRKALDVAYTQIGCKKGVEVPLGQVAGELSDRLFVSLNAPDGLVEKIKKLHSQLKRSRPDEIPDIEAEHFGLFLWLRIRSYPNNPAPYAINLVGSSVFHHREEWSARRQEEITPRSEYVAVQALFTGRTELVNVNEGVAQKRRPDHVWRGILATPVSISGLGTGASSDGTVKKMLDRVTIGVATLNTTSHISKNEAGVVPHPQSVISWANVEQLRSVAEAVEKCLGPIVNPAPPSN